MKTKFGPEAKDGDYVLVLDNNYMSGRATTYIAKVYRGKAYTGQTMYSVKGRRYIHKMSAEVIIPESIVSTEIKTIIDEDIKIHNQER